MCITLSLSPSSKHGSHIGTLNLWTADLNVCVCVCVCVLLSWTHNLPINCVWSLTCNIWKLVWFGGIVWLCVRSQRQRHTSSICAKFSKCLLGKKKKKKEKKNLSCTVFFFSFFFMNDAFDTSSLQNRLFLNQLSLSNISSLTVISLKTVCVADILC